MKATLHFTNPQAQMSSMEIFKSPMMSGSDILKISESPANNSFLGFGVAITGSSCYVLSKMDASKRRSLLEHIYGKDGLNLSVARLSIGASDYSAELYSYDDVPFDTALEHFSIDKDRAYILPIIKEILEIRPDLYLFASPWSPPAWMKTGNCLCMGYMREEFVDCYADYLIKYLQAYEAEGIHVSAITPQNETETQQSGEMPACIWHPEIEAKFIKCLKSKLKALGMDTKIWMFDHNFKGAMRVKWTLDICEGLAQSTDGIAFHYYEGTIEQTLLLKEAYPKLRMHFTEGGPRLYDNYSTDWCKWGIMISKALCADYGSFTGWNLALDEFGHPNLGIFGCGGLVTVNSTTHEVCDYSGQYKAMKHIAPYITPESKIYSIGSDAWVAQAMFEYPKDNKPLCGFLIDNGNKKIAVIINQNTFKRPAQLMINGELYYIPLLADSINTIIFE